MEGEASTGTPIISGQYKIK